METTSYGPPHRSSYALPEIYIQTSTVSDQKTMSGRSSSSGSRPSPPSNLIPMSIPNARHDDSPPPPLPPPRFVGIDGDRGNGGSVDPGWAWSNSRESHRWDRMSSVKQGSSLYGSPATGGSHSGEGLDLRRGNSASTIKSTADMNGNSGSYSRPDEGYASLSTGASMSSYQ